MAKKKIRVQQSFYDTDRFYSILSALGKKEATDKEIAAALNITPETFSRMKNGKYDGWTEKENEERSERICQVLSRARASLITALKDSYIKLATGNAKSTTTRFVQARCMCNGQDRECPACGGTGYITLTDRAVVMEQFHSFVGILGLVNFHPTHRPSQLCYGTIHQNGAKMKMKLMMKMVGSQQVTSPFGNG